MIFKKNIKKTAVIIIFAVTIAFISGHSYAFETVYYDFKEVELNTTRKATVSISTNSNSEVVLKTFKFQNESYFELISDIPPGGIVVSYGETVGVEIAFTPANLGSVTDILNISTEEPTPFNPNPPPIVAVNLSGTGISDIAITIDGILDFFDSAVESGILIGNGGATSDDILLAYSADQKNNNTGNENKSPENKVQTLRKMLVSAGKLIESEDLDGACSQLMSISKKCDGEDRPPDFVLGVGQPNPVSQLENMIANLSESLECK